MKLVTLTAAATLAMSASAFAYTGVSPTMLSSVESILEEAGMDNVDITTLSDEQIVQIYTASQSGDQTDMIGIEGYLDADNYSMRSVTERRMGMTDMDMETGLAPMGENSIVTSVQNVLDRQGYEVDASTLTDAQVAEIYFLAFSGDQADPADYEAVLGM